MTAAIDWRPDANLPARTFTWRTWWVVVAVALLGAAALMVVFIRSTTQVTGAACRMREASQGVPYLAASGVAVGQPLPPGWAPGPHVRVVHASGYAPRGLVVDASTCLSRKADQLTVVVAG